MPSFPAETSEYREARDRLLQHELELRRAIEAVAQARRELPPGGEVPEDYVFTGADGDVKFTELFEGDKDTLAVYSFMFKQSPCPMCSQFLDAFDGVIAHARETINVAVVARAEHPRLAEYADQRGWHDLPLLSAAHNTYPRDYYGESEDGSQLPMLNVFRRDADGTIRHFWASELMFAPTDPGQDPRHADSIDPLWNLFDFMPDGRPDDWMPSR
jgi:predicted dithiol-disulfide oxidoreductase (DUF899 family)